jgi:hypothetical protein
LKGTLGRVVVEFAFTGCSVLEDLSCMGFLLLMAPTCVLDHWITRYDLQFHETHVVEARGLPRDIVRTYQILYHMVCLLERWVKRPHRAAEHRVPDEPRYACFPDMETGIRSIVQEAKTWARRTRTRSSIRRG